MKTHWKKLTNPTYLGAYDFAEGEKRVLTIDKVLQDKVKGQDGKDEDCTICHFVGSKPMILNVTNCKAIAKAYGTNYIEEWSDKKVTIFVTMVSAFGQTVEALRIEQIQPKEKSPMSDARFEQGLKAVKEGKTTIESIQNSYKLTDKQIKTLQS